MYEAAAATLRKKQRVTAATAAVIQIPAPRGSEWLPSQHHRESDTRSDTDRPSRGSVQTTYSARHNKRGSRRASSCLDSLWTWASFRCWSPVSVTFQRQNPQIAWSRDSTRFGPPADKQSGSETASPSGDHLRQKKTQPFNLSINFIDTLQPINC